MAHITSEQRYTISVLLQQKNSISAISRTIGKHKSVVSREIGRNSSPGGEYDACYAVQKAKQRQSERKRFRRFTPDIQQYVDQRIMDDYSPEQVVGRARREGIPCVSITTIYKYIWEQKQDPKARDKLFHHLRIGHRKCLKNSSIKRGMGIIPDRSMIDERPEIANRRERFGDFEADTMWIANKAVIVTLNDRATGLSFIKALPNRKANLVNEAIYDMLKNIIPQVHTITVDNGKEFYKHKQLAEKLQADVFFAHPYASYERGSNENLNRLYRQYLPRNTKIDSLTDGYIRQLENRLNNRPRKRFNFLSPIEYFLANFENAVLHL